MCIRDRCKLYCNSYRSSWWPWCICCSSIKVSSIYRISSNIAYIWYNWPTCRRGIFKNRTSRSPTCLTRDRKIFIIHIWERNVLQITKNIWSWRIIRSMIRMSDGITEGGGCFPLVSRSCNNCLEIHFWTGWKFNKWSIDKRSFTIITPNRICISLWNRRICFISQYKCCLLYTSRCV